MPALTKTEYTGVISWLGTVRNRGVSLRAEPLSQLSARFEGADGDTHSGLVRPSCVRVSAQYPEGTEIRNVRQFSVLSAEELDEIAEDMGLAELDPALLGATMVISGLPDFSHVPPSARLQGSSGATLVVDMQNRPCVYPAREIEADHTGYGKAFLAAAKGRRGVTAWVEREGAFRNGDQITLHIPDQRAWRGA